MKIGYPCLNYSIGVTANKTFRLASYSPERFYLTVANNIDALEKIIAYNIDHGLMFFRMSSEMIPFASHPVMQEDWLKHFAADFKRIGKVIHQSRMRISMHPDQFVLINSPKKEVVQKSIADLRWHVDLMNALGLDLTAKVQIHVGGVYGDKTKAMGAFIANYQGLPPEIKDRLVIENDDTSFSLRDCLQIYEATGIPIIFDNFHHACLNEGESLKDAITMAKATWGKKDGILMCDYSSQQPQAVEGKHADTINTTDFAGYLKVIKGIDCDIMLEIRDKEKSALKALAIMEAR